MEMSDRIIWGRPSLTCEMEDLKAGKMEWFEVVKLEN